MDGARKNAASKPSRRGISDEELANVLARALELDSGDRRSIDQREGHSIEEAESIATEAGISAGSFHAALAELERGSTLRPRLRWLAGQLRPGSRLVVDGSPSKENLEDIFDELSEITRTRGGGNIGKKGLHWFSDGYENQRSGRALDVTVTPKLLGTEISVQYDLRNAAGGVYGGVCGGLGLGFGLGIGFGVGMGALGSPLFAALFPLGSLVASYFLSHGLVSLLSRRSAKEAERIADLIAERLEELSTKA